MRAAATAPLLQVGSLTVDVDRAGLSTRIVDGVDFAINAGERLALVGESGSGKSVTAQALIRLNRRVRIGGQVRFDGVDLLALNERALTAVRGAQIGMAFQDPMTSLDPIMTIGDQVAETLRIRGVARGEARRRAVAILDELGVPNAARRLDSYVHEFSGGMRQRVVIAMALIGNPRLLIADEPTTALDVRVQEQVLELLDEVASQRSLAVILITHDLGVVASFAERVLVMYSGRIAEDAPVDALFAEPQHPYASGLLASAPRIDRTEERLTAIPGAPAPPSARPPGCAFHPRCPLALDRCRADIPAPRRFGVHLVACHRAGEADTTHAF